MLHHGYQSEFKRVFLAHHDEYWGLLRLLALLRLWHAKTFQN